jgi:hypothetical protein
MPVEKNYVRICISFALLLCFAIGPFWLLWWPFNLSSELLSSFSDIFDARFIIGLSRIWKWII